MNDALTHGFNCILPDEPPQILILGSLPSVASVTQQQYYAHPQNAFWRIIEALFAECRPLDYAQRIELLNQHRIALWDVHSIYLNGGSAAALFKRHIAQHLPRPLNVVTLPSTSPANARLRFEEKLEKWRVVWSDCINLR